MKKIILSLVFGLFLISQSYAALIKSTAEIINWTAVAAATTYTTPAVDLSGNYQSLIQIDVALTSKTATTNGMGIVVQTSSNTVGNITWADYASYTCIAGTTAGLSNTSDAVTAAGSTLLLLPVTSTGVSAGQLMYMRNSTNINNSEMVRVNNLTANVSATIIDALANGYTNLTNIWCGNSTYTGVVAIPDSANRVRIIFDNTKDASGSGVEVRARLDKITGI